jgi:head-tail adaptor
MLRGLRPSEYDRRITIQSPTSLQDSVSKQMEKTWSDLQTISAKRIFKKSSEKFEANQQVGSDQAEYQIRWPDFTIDKTMRFVDTLESQTYYITGIMKTDRKVSMTLIGQIRDNE